MLSTKMGTSRPRYEVKEASDMLTMGSVSGQMCTKTIVSG